jgi:hypothetical protein
MQTPAESPPSPFRLAVDELLAHLADGALSTLNLIERTAVMGQLHRRGWDLGRLSRRGPLRDVTDEQLMVLIEAAAERLDEVLLDHADARLGALPPLDEALSALRRSLQR